MKTCRFKYYTCVKNSYKRQTRIVAGCFKYYNTQLVHIYRYGNIDGNFIS